MEYVAGVDIGTTNTKAMIFDLSGHCLGSASVKSNISFLPGGYVEQDASKWYLDTCRVLREAAGKSGIDHSSIKAVSLSSQGISIVPVDKELAPLSEAVNWMDNRAGAEAYSLTEILGTEYLRHVTGKLRAGGDYALPKIMWFRSHRPEIHKQAFKYLMPLDYCIAHMTDRVVTDHTMVAGSLAYHVERQCLDEKILSASGIDGDLFPEIVRTGTTVGHFNRKTAELTGFPEDCIVVTGGQDQKVAAYGAGLSAGSATLSMGTCGAFEFMTGRDTFDFQSGMTLCPYITEDSYVIEGCINTLCAAIDWMKNLLYQDSDYEAMNREAEKFAGSCEVKIAPFFSGTGTPHHESGDKRAQIYGLCLGTKRGEILYALYEALSEECLLNVREAEKTVPKIRELRVFSGGSENSLLCRMIAEKCGIPVVRQSFNEMGILGAAKIAASGIGCNPELFSKTHAQHLMA